MLAPLVDGLCESQPGQMKSKCFQGKIQLDAWWPNFPIIGNGIIFPEYVIIHIVIFPDVIFHIVIFLLQFFLLQSHQCLFLLTGDRKCHFYYSKALQPLLLSGSISKKWKLSHMNIFFSDTIPNNLKCIINIKMPQLHQQQWCCF